MKEGLRLITTFFVMVLLASVSFICLRYKNKMEKKELDKACIQECEESMKSIEFKFNIENNDRHWNFTNCKKLCEKSYKMDGNK